MISIVIPTFNEEKEVEKTVRQFETLTMPHEVIVSDTSSTDRTVAIARTCANQILTLPPNQNPGVAVGRNNGGNAARGNLIVFIDASVTIPNLNQTFDLIVKAFDSDPRLVGLSGRVEVDPQIRRFSDWLIFGAMNLYYWALNNMFHIGIAIGKFQVVRAGAFRASGGFDETLVAAEDVDFFARLSRIGRTRLAWNIVAFHSGRRFHQAGAWKTLYRWIKNAVWLWIFKKPADKEWETIR